MGFKKQADLIDFGTTAIENIFINDFMPMANGTFVKVYLTGFKCAGEPESGLIWKNATIAKHLDLTLEDVLSAWDFWEKKGIVKKHAHSDLLGDYDIEFLSLRQLYIDNNFSQRQAESSTKPTMADVIDSTRNPELQEMFYQIDQLMRRQLQAKERQEILSWIYDFNRSPEMVIKAFYFSVEEKGVKNINYVRSVLTNWYDQALNTPESVDEHLSYDNKAYMSYRTVYKTLGYTNRTVSAGDKEIIDKWLNTFGLDLQFIVTVLKDRSSRTSNVNMKYMDAAIVDLFNRGIRTISAFEAEQAAFEAQKSAAKATSNSGNSKPSDQRNTQNTGSKNKFHNFQKSSTTYTEKELEQMLRTKK